MTKERISINQQIEGLRREITRGKRECGKLATGKRALLAEARYQVRRLEAALRTLEYVRDNRAAFLKALEADKRKADGGDIEASAAAAVGAIAAIKAMKPQCGDNGGIACPLCGGVLKYSVAGSKNHIRAKCETDNCLTIVE
jgi:hypothetical protein